MSLPAALWALALSMVFHFEKLREAL